MAERIAFFDVDHTLLRRSTGAGMALEAWKKRIVPFRLVLSLPFHYLRYRCASAGEDVFTAGMAVVRGISRETFRTLAGEAFQRRYLRDIFPAITERMAFLRRGGAKIILATSSVDLFVAPLARHTGADGVIASELEFSGEKCTGRFSGKPVFGSEKLRRVSAAAGEVGVSLSECSFYSDSIHDLPLLEAVGCPVAVNPDRRLGRIARQRGWEILRCRIPSQRGCR